MFTTLNYIFTVSIPVLESDLGIPGGGGGGGGWGGVCAAVKGMVFKQFTLA